MKKIIIGFFGVILAIGICFGVGSIFNHFIMFENVFITCFVGGISILMLFLGFFFLYAFGEFLLYKINDLKEYIEKIQKN